MQSEEQRRFLRPAARHPLRLRRGVSLLPSLFTMGNMFCGYACIVYAMRGDFETAAPFIGIAVVLDMLDGREDGKLAPGNVAGTVKPPDAPLSPNEFLRKLEKS